MVELCAVDCLGTLSLKYIHAGTDRSCQVECAVVIAEKEKTDLC